MSSLARWAVPHTDESIPSLLGRLTELNAVSQPTAISQYVQQRLDYVCSLSSPTDYKIYEILSELTDGIMSTLRWYELSYHSYANVLSLSSDTIDFPRWGKMPVLHMLSKEVRADHNAQFCPNCLAEKPRHRRIWGVNVIYTCPKHRCYLQTDCDSCGEQADAYSIALNRCRNCSHALSNNPLTFLYDEDEITVQTWLYHLLGIPETPLPIEKYNLPNVSARVLYRLWRAFTNFATGDSPQVTAFETLHNWPHNFRHYLNGVANISGLRATLRHYNAWDSIDDEMYLYRTHYITDDSPSLKSLRQARYSAKYVRIADVAIQLEVLHKVIQRLVLIGQLNAVKIVDVLDENKPIVPLHTRCKIQERGWLITRTSFDSLLHNLIDVSILVNNTDDLIPLGESYHLSKVPIADTISMIVGQAVNCFSDSDGKIYLHSDALAGLQTKRQQHEGVLKRAEAVKELKVNSSIVTHLLARGFLHSNHRKMIKIDSLKAFQDDYVRHKEALLIIEAGEEELWRRVKDGEIVGALDSLSPRSKSQFYRRKDLEEMR